MQLRILFMGMHGHFSLPPFRALVESGRRPIALVTPPPPGMPRPFHRLAYPLLSVNEVNVYQLAAEQGIPIFEISRLNDPEVLEWLDSLHLDLIVVACFNRLLPKSWLDTPKLGCINLHPSLLPAYRGPAPLEDQLANGETSTGITLHFMNEIADSGDIIVQQSLPVPAGTDLSSLERRAAEVGAALLLKILASPEDIPRRPQG